MEQNGRFEKPYFWGVRFGPALRGSKMTHLALLGSKWTSKMTLPTRLLAALITVASSSLVQGDGHPIYLVDPAPDSGAKKASKKGVKKGQK